MNAIIRDIPVTRKGIMEKIEVTKGTNMIPLVFNITDFQIPKTASATAYITGASGKTKKKLCDVVGNRITLEPTSDLFSVGNNDIQIRIVDETKTLVTFNTNCYCENSVEFGDAAEEKEQTLIEQLLASQGKIQTGLNNEVEERKKQAKNLEDNKLDKTGDASDTTIDFTESLNRENIVSGEKARTMFGKISKWFSDIREAAFAKVANNLDTTEEGYVLDARQGKKIKEDITDLNSKSYEIIKSSNGYVKKYADGRFEAYIRITIQNAFNFTQIGNSGIYYATFSNAAIGITAVEVTSIITNAANNGVIWSGNAYLNSNNQAINGTVLQYGMDKTRATTIMAEVKGRWK